MIAITLNGQSVEIAAPLSLDALLRLQQIPREGIAVALDDQVIPRSRYHDLVIGAGARLEIIRAVAGG